jgi:hypothetical protein
MWLIALVMEQTFLFRLDQLCAGGVKDVARGGFNPRCEVVEFVAAPGRCDASRARGA